MSTQYDVALVPCSRYDDSEVESALRKAVEQTGGLDFINPGMRIAVKLNLVTAMKPETAATVHWRVFSGTGEQRLCSVMAPAESILLRIFGLYTMSAEYAVRNSSVQN